jgi:tryptophan-rich sensory protein
MTRYSVRVQAAGLVGWLLVSFAAAAVGGIASAQAGDFYRQLDRPHWAPPGWVFGPVWSVLYALQGVSAWLVWRERDTVGRRRAALSAFLAQLAVNALWSWLFFAWRLGGMAFGEVVLLFLMVGLSVALSWRVRPLAGTLLLPYLLWVGFATALTYSIWQRNPQLLG